MRTFLAATGAVALLAAGCGGDEPASSEPQPLETSTAASSREVPEGVPTGPPPEPPAKQADTFESAEEYAKSFVRALYHSFNVRETEHFLAFVPDDKEQDVCKGCVDTQKTLARAEREGWYSVVDLDKIGYSDTQEVAREANGLVLGMVIDQPAGQRVEDGKGVVGTVKAEPNQYMEVLLAWERGQWQVWNFGFPNS